MKLTLLLMLLVAQGLILGCNSNKNFPAVPLGDKKSLEQLADAYRVESDRLPTSPTSLAAKGRKIFIQAVFSRADFDYGKTLKNLSQTEMNDVTQLHKDLAQLISMPHNNMSDDTRKEFYSKIELSVIEKIDRIMK